jgi:hypothetical protein
VITSIYRSIRFRIPAQPDRRLCHNSENEHFVILNEVKNLMFTTGYKIKILRLTPQNDIMTQPPGGESGMTILGQPVKPFFVYEIL